MKSIVTIVIGILIGIGITIPATVFAIKGTKPIYSVSSNEMTVSVFDDADNKCYVFVGQGKFEINPTIGGSISCVKR